MNAHVIIGTVHMRNLQSKVGVVFPATIILDKQDLLGERYANMRLF